MRSNKQIQSAARNLAKMRLMGLTGNPFSERGIILTSEEKVLLRKIGILKTQLLNSWDENTKSVMKSVNNEIRDNS